MQPRASHLPDIQKTPDERGIDIDEVGVSNIRYPIAFPLRDGGFCHTVATISMRVSLPHYEKGTHMSRFMIALQEKVDVLSPSRVFDVLSELLRLLDADTAYLDMSFPIFLKREAPVTRLAGLLDFECGFKGVLKKDGTYDKVVEVRVNAASLCPCSKEISAYGAHNQRSRITIKVREHGELIWFEDLVDIAERNASCALFPILKRPDEKFVTERAYDNPKFVEDIVRDVAVDLLAMLRDERIRYFFVSSNNFESIHNHDAYAHVERGELGSLLSGFSHD
ncbi:MAG: GTP cyclohydrolase I FolE2 [Candidatus Sumerlaeia bacterium]|nr:GTP cyclohydrolase I FolE2 [Candidatus Sumerlaeia bacterium]